MLEGQGMLYLLELETHNGTFKFKDKMHVTFRDVCDHRKEWPI